MQRLNFPLILFLLLCENPTCCGSTTSLPEEESSGEVSLPTAKVAMDPTPTVVPSSNSEQEQPSATALPAFTTTTVNDTSPVETAEVNLAVIYAVPALLLLILLVLPIFLIARRHKRKQSKEDELGSENCKSPIFEEDTPSVMEIEMEELDKWMNSLKRNAECEYLPPVKEEKDYNTNPSDCESWVKVALHGLKEETQKRPENPDDLPSMKS